MTRQDTEDDLRGPGFTDFSLLGDASLAAAVAAGRREALAEAYERHSAAVYDVAHALVGEQLARRVVQKTFLGLWQMPATHDPAETLRSRLLKRAHLAAVDHLRSNNASAAPRSRESAKHAWPLLSLLPPEERRAIWMTYFVGYSARELAVHLHQPEHVVRRRIIDGLRRLRALREAATAPAND